MSIGFLYNRDKSIRTPFKSGSFFAGFGSSIKFDNKVKTVEKGNNYISKMPLGLNSLKATVSLNFQNIRDGQAATLLDAFDSISSQQGTGNGFVSITKNNENPINDEFPDIYLNLDSRASPIYKNINGAKIKSYDDSVKQNFLHDVSVELVADRFSAYTNWSGLFPYIVVGSWNSSQYYEENSVIFYEEDFSGGYKNQNKRDSFFYCKKTHTSASNLVYLPKYEGSEYWTQDFFWEPDEVVSIEKNKEGDAITYEGGFFETIKQNSNSNLLKLSLTFTNRSDKETRAILHFLENRMGYKSFVFNFNGIYKFSKRFFATDWEHTFNFHNSNNISVNVVEQVNSAQPRIRI